MKYPGGLPQPLEVLCCNHCGYEYDRHIGDMCPNCGHNNHEQYVEKFARRTNATKPVEVPQKR